MKLTKQFIKELVEQELQNMSYEMAPGTGEEGVSGIAEPQMSMEPEDEEEESYSTQDRAYAAANKATKIYSMGAGHPYLGTVQETKIAKLKRLIRRSMQDIVSEGDITREKRYQWDDSEPESAGEPEPPPEPDAPPVSLIKQAKDLHAALMQNVQAPVSGDRDIALNRVIVRRDLKELGDILDELAEHIGPADGDTEIEARGHEGDGPGFEMPEAPSTHSAEHGRRRFYKNR